MPPANWTVKVTTPKRPNNAAGYAVFVVLGMLVAGCGAKSGVATGPSPRPFPGAAAPPRSTPSAPSAPAADAAAAPLIETPVVSLALSLKGTPYRNGGSDPTGFDCSGFVQWVFAQQGLALPREVRDQYRVGSEIESAAIKAGDLVFFETVSKGASHVGIALGDGTFVHAPSSNGVVRVERYTSGYWADRWVGARRVS